MKVIIFEDFIKNTREIVKDVLDFLQVYSEPPQKINEVFNPYSVPRNAFMKFIFNSPTIIKFARKILPPSIKRFISYNILVKEVEKPIMKEADREYLQKIYAKDVKELQLLLGSNLPWKNFI